MIDADNQAILLAIVQRESRSLLQYVSEAFPWITREEPGALANLQRIIDEELASAGTVARYLQRHRVPTPPLDSYPASFTSLNFVAFDSLLPILVEHQRKAIAELEANTARLSDGEARTLVQHLLDRKRRHLTELEQMTVSVRTPATVP